jgi:hypothetical protein
MNWRARRWLNVGAKLIAGSIDETDKQPTAFIATIYPFADMSAS